MGGFFLPTTTSLPTSTSTTRIVGPRPLPPRPSTLGQNYTQSTPGQTYSRGMDFPSGTDDMKGFFMELARRKYAADAAARAAAPPMIGGAGARPRIISAPAPSAGERTMKTELERAREVAEMDQLAAASGRAPTKLVTIAGQSFYVPDELAMNAYQRKLFLPDSATAAGDINAPSRAAGSFSPGFAIEGGAPGGGMDSYAQRYFRAYGRPPGGQLSGMVGEVGPDGRPVGPPAY